MLIAQRPTLTEEKIAEFRSRFVIEPLEPGFGYTIGNALRRSLLSSIPGAAVTSIRIDGVLHEFSTIPGVKEDVTEIILNIKQLVVSSERDEPITAYLRKTGAGEVTAADISAPAGVEVHNPELVIATLNDSAKFELELTIERGRGYVSATQNRNEYAEAGQIPIDSIYSPVLKVSYRVDATRAGERTDFDKLVLDVETKNSIAPARRRRIGRSHADRAVRPGPRAQRRGRGHRDRPRAGRDRPLERAVDADRGSRSVGALVQLPQARGHQHRQRARRPLGDAAHEHPQLRSEVGRRGARQAHLARTVAEGLGSRVRRRALLRRLRRRDRLIRPRLDFHTGVIETMPKPTKGPRLGGGPAHERLLLANLAAALFTHKSIKTTETKAKRLRPLAERLVTFAKRGDLHARRRVLSVIGDKEVVHVLFTEIAPLVADREGGYTRITKVGNRKGDNAPMAVIELVLEPVMKKPSAKKAAKADAAPATAVEEAPADETVVEEAAADEAPAEDAGAESQEEGAAAEAAADDAVETPAEEKSE